MPGRASFFQAAQRIPVGKEYDISEANAVTYTPDQLEDSNHWLGGVEGVQVQLRPYRTFLLPSSSVTVTHHTKSALLQVFVPHAFFSPFWYSHLRVAVAVQLQTPTTRTATDTDRERLKRKTPHFPHEYLPLTPGRKQKKKREDLHLLYRIVS